MTHDSEQERWSDEELADAVVMDHDLGDVEMRQEIARRLRGGEGERGLLAQDSLLVSNCQSPNRGHRCAVHVNPVEEDWGPKKLTEPVAVAWADDPGVATAVALRRADRKLRSSLSPTDGEERPKEVYTYEGDDCTCPHGDPNGIGAWKRTGREVTCPIHGTNEAAAPDTEGREGSDRGEYLSPLEICRILEEHFQEHPELVHRRRTGGHIKGEDLARLLREWHEATKPRLRMQAMEEEIDRLRGAPEGAGEDVELKFSAMLPSMLEVAAEEVRAAGPFNGPLYTRSVPTSLLRGEFANYLEEKAEEIRRRRVGLRTGREGRDDG